MRKGVTPVPGNRPNTSIRISIEERKVIEEAAKAAGISYNHYIREAALAKAQHDLSIR